MCTAQKLNAPCIREAREIVLCHKCVADRKIILQPNILQRRTRQYAATICPLFTKTAGRQASTEKMHLLCYNVCFGKPWRVELGKRNLETSLHLEASVSILSYFCNICSWKFKDKTRGVIKIWVYIKTELCLFLSQPAYMLMRRCIQRWQVRVMRGFENQICQLMNVPDNRQSIEYERLTESNPVLMIVNHHTPNIFETRSSNDEKVNLEALGDQPVCSSHMWALSRSGKTRETITRPVVEHIIYTLETVEERKTKMWVRRKIFNKDILVSQDVIFGNGVSRIILDCAKTPKGSQRQSGIFCHE